jgi:hypothetical protein
MAMIAIGHVEVEVAAIGLSAGRDVDVIAVDPGGESCCVAVTLVASNLVSLQRRAAGRLIASGGAHRDVVSAAGLARPRPPSRWCAR